MRGLRKVVGHTLLCAARLRFKFRLRQSSDASIRDVCAGYNLYFSALHLLLQYFLALLLLRSNNSVCLIFPRNPLEMPWLNATSIELIELLKTYTFRVREEEPPEHSCDETEPKKDKADLSAKMACVWIDLNIVNISTSLRDGKRLLTMYGIVNCMIKPYTP